MRKEAQILLAFIRETSERQVAVQPGHTVQPDHISVLRDVLEITDYECMEIGELLKADIRESTVRHPQFTEINAILD